MPKRDKFQDTQLCMTGEHYVAAELWRQGWIAGLTPKNYPGFDIIAHHPQTHQQAAIQVKTRLLGPREHAWDVQVPTNREQYAPFVVIVAVRKTQAEDPPSYATDVLTGEEAFQLAKRTHEEYISRSPHVKPDEQHYVLNGKDLEEQYRNKWQKIVSVVP